MATRITPSGKIEVITPTNSTTFSASEMHELVGGYLECLRLRDGRIMWFDEGGKLKGKPANMLATLLALNALPPGDLIVGTVVLTSLAEAGETVEQKRAS